MDITETMERLKEYKKDKEEKQKLEKEMYQKECIRYENTIYSMKHEMDQMVDLFKIAKECFNERQFAFFNKNKESISFNRDENGFYIYGNNKFASNIYKNDDIGAYEIYFKNNDDHLILMKTFVENFEKFKQEKIEYINKILDGKI